jgi:hypothetical protein
VRSKQRLTNACAAKPAVKQSGNSRRRGNAKAAQVLLLGQEVEGRGAKLACASLSLWAGRRGIW